MIGAAGIGLVWSTSSHPTELRVAALKHDNGQIEVGLQQRDRESENGWSERHLPRFRFLSSDVDSNRWYYSSGVEIETPAPERPSTTTLGPFQIVGTPTISRPFDDQTLFCVVTHSHPNDFFWFQVYSALADSKHWNSLNLRADMSTRVVDQAAAVDKCVADGAAAIATTLPNADALQPSIERAIDAGVRVITFNSGADRATEVGSAAHVALDESEVGATASEQFLAHEVSGDILCIIHERSNSGLEQRCDALQAHYEASAAGSVIRVRTHDAADVSEAIAAAITDDVVGALALNANTAYAMVEAFEQQPEAILAAVTADFLRPIAMLYNAKISFVLWSHALEQGYLTMSALLYAHGSPTPPEVGLFTEATQISIRPSVLTVESVRDFWDGESQFRDTLPAWADALERAIAAEAPDQSSEN